MNYLRLMFFVGFFVFAVFPCVSLPALAQDHPDSGSVERISPEAAKALLDSGEAIMVCSYDDQRCSKMMIEGAVTKSELDARKDNLPKDQNLIFYCG